MEKITLKRNGREDLVFLGEQLVAIDDRELMGVTPNWWELSLYRTDTKKYVLASTFHLNYPYRRKMYGAVCFNDPQGVREYLVNECNGPVMIAEALLSRAARRDSAFATGRQSERMLLPVPDLGSSSGAGAGAM